MNTELKKTLAFVGVAVVLLATTAWATRPRHVTAEAFADQGKPFFPDFQDPREAAALEVIDFVPSTASALPFKVEFTKEKGWTIPSHYDYPADAKDRLAKTAAGLIDLKKDVIRSQRPDQHEELGVLDPLDTRATSLQGRGKRITVKAQDGKVLADLIVGKPVPGQPGQRYVRVPDKPWTYSTVFDVDLSNRFADWIETDLLKLDAFHIDKITIDNHKVDVAQGVILPGEVIELDRTPPSGPWSINPPPSPEQEVDTAKVSKLTSAVAGLKIVGVRPKPEGVTRDLKALSAKGEGGQLTIASSTIRLLTNRGFYILRDGSIRSDEGEAVVSTDEGLRYTLRFGGVTAATGEALTAGSPEEEAEKSESEKSEEDTKKEEKADATDNRFVMVSVEFDPNLVPKPDSMKGISSNPPLGDQVSHVFARTAEEAKTDDDKAKREKEDYEKKLADGKKKAEQLTERFADWFYVVPGDNYRDIVVQRESLLKPKGSTTSQPGTNLPSGLNLPPGLNLNPGQSPAGANPHGDNDGPPPIP